MTGVIRDPSSQARDGLAMTIAVITLLLYVVLVVVLIFLRHDTDWDRLVYLLGGFEAIVFTAAGWVFGTTVQRSKVAAAEGARDQAREDATNARASEEVARTERDAVRTDAERGRALGTIVKAKASSLTTAREGSRPEDELPVDKDLAEILEVAQRLFPEPGQ
jgi:hypothetical protein